jgi:oxaloacetate decarboxylase gamma subunit
LSEAAVLLGVGMVVVFVFLSVLILAVYGISWLCQKFPEEQVDSNVNVNLSRGLASRTVRPDIAEAINIAVKQYRTSN